ncbi:MAG TPA: tetratricopeptide repeat protein [Gemmata sp.]|nr:tetratricopeptide repeat protein [Gemmata sp.]
MTVHDALAEGRLAQALELAQAAVESDPNDPAARRLLVDLLAFAGRLEEAIAQLAEIRTDDSEWPAIRLALVQLFEVERWRSAECREPKIRPEPIPKHASLRWLAIAALRRGQPEDAVDYIDAADRVSPECWGFLDGREFEGLRDADDRFASVLEAFVAGDYFWFAWEGLRKVSLSPAAVLIDQLYRPAMVTLKDGKEIACRLPMVYPDSHLADGVFALGMETDHISPDRGPTRCIGGKLLLMGDGAEVPLAECRMIEIR